MPTPFTPNSAFFSSKVQIYAGLLALYLIWGSTYLGIRLAIDSIPTFLMAGSRNLLAGLLLYGFSRIFLKIPRPTLREWGVCMASGMLLLFAGNGGITLVEHWIPSGFVALVVACVPVWIVLLQWIFFKEKPTPQVLVGVGCGIVGVGLLVANNLTLKGSEGMFYPALAITLLSTLGWSFGVIYMKRKKLSIPTIQIAGMQQLSGGVALLLLGLFRNETSGFLLSQVSATAWTAYFYLIVFGSVVGFTIFGWLSKVAAPTLVATYSYVNPLVAVVLGWLVLSEPLQPGIIFPALLIILAVVLITLKITVLPARHK